MDEDSESYMAIDECDKKELVWRFFQLFVLGGRLNQYEDSAKPYKNATKLAYKNFVKYFFLLYKTSVKKDQSTNHVFVESTF